MALKRKLDEEVINTIHYKEWDKAKAKTEDGLAISVPKDVADRIAERDRAMYCLIKWVRDGSKGSVYNFLTSYGLRNGSLEWVIKKFCEEEDLTAPEKKKSQKMRWRDLERFATEHVYEQFTTAQLAEVGGFSTGTVVKWLSTTRYYNKVKRGLYEARDPWGKSVKSK